MQSRAATAYQKRKEYQYTKLLKAKAVFDPQRDEVYIGPTFRTQPPPNYPSRRFTASNVGWCHTHYPNVVFFLD